MIGSGEAEARAVAGAVKSAVGQARLDAGVNIASLLVDIDMADSVDCRQYFMCWHLTRVLGPSLTEMVPPAVVRGVTNNRYGVAAYRFLHEGSRSAELQMHCAAADWLQLDGDWPAMVNASP
ncbi:MAG: hypothetical protein ACRDSZ_22305 [Pseudonocardiaceae bacterium]